MTTLWLLMGVLGVLALAHVAAARLLADALTRTKRRRVEGTPTDLGLRYEDVQFGTPDGVALRGWYLESPGARGTVILVHDIDGTRSDRSQGLLTLQRDYLRRGLNVLAFDLRGRGESGGSRDCLGASERTDVAAAVEFARDRARHLPLILHGFGLGGALAIVGASDGLDVDLIIADSPFASARSYLRRRWSNVPGYLFSMALRVATSRFGANADAVRPLVSASQSSPVPILFIHCDADRLVPLADTLNIAAASLNAHNAIWRVPGAGHCAGYLRAPDAYVRQCLAFIEDAVPARRITAVAV